MVGIRGVSAAKPNFHHLECGLKYYQGTVPLAGVASETESSQWLGFGLIH